MPGKKPLRVVPILLILAMLLSAPSVRAQPTSSGGRHAQILAGLPYTARTRPPSAQEVVDFSLKFLGNGFRWNSYLPPAFDSSGLMLYVWAKHGYVLPRKVKGQTSVGVAIPLARESLKPCDLLFFKNQFTNQPRHVGMYIGDGKFIHAVGGSDYMVRLDTLAETGGWWKHLVMVRRLITQQPGVFEPGQSRARAAQQPSLEPVKPRQPLNNRAHQQLSHRQMLPLLDCMIFVQQQNPPAAGQVIGLARAYLGKGYVLGGHCPPAFDSSGLMVHLWSRFGYVLPRISYLQAEIGDPVELTLAAVKPGDLVFFKVNGSERINRVGVYAGSDRFITSVKGTGVRELTLFQDANYRSSLVAVRRILTLRPGVLEPGKTHPRVAGAQPQPDPRAARLLPGLPYNARSRPVGQQKVVDFSLKFLGNPYRAGSYLPPGFNSSGLMLYVWSKFGYVLPRKSREQAKVGEAVRPNKENLRCGDLVFFNLSREREGVDHAGLYLGDGKFIHATGYRDQRVKIDDMFTDRRYRSAIKGARRILTQKPGFLEPGELTARVQSAARLSASCTGFQREREQTQARHSQMSHTQLLPLQQCMNYRPLNGAPSANEVIGYAKRLLGLRYHYGDSCPMQFDCSGLMLYTWAKFGYVLPRVSRDQATIGRRVAKDQSAIKPGDLLFFRTANSAGIKHVGMYIGDGKFIHASGGNTNGRVKIDTIFGGHARYWKNLLHSVRRILPLRPKVLEPR